MQLPDQRENMNLKKDKKREKGTKKEGKQKAHTKMFKLKCFSTQVHA